MKNYNFSILILFASLPALVGCTGPTSPFGAIHFWDGDGEELVFSDNAETDGIHFKPGRQVLHMQSDLDVSIRSPSLINSDDTFRVTYDGRDVTRTFLKTAKNPDTKENKIHLTFPNLKLRSDRNHRIGVEFTSNQSGMQIVRYFGPPECSYHEILGVESTAPFSPDPSLLEMAIKEGSQEDVNPALLVGLIAQESGFNPNVVSRSRAVGLTQVTPLADKEIFELTPDWPRDSRIEKLPLSELKESIATGLLTAKNDWRLDANKSISGGVKYLSFLKRYWEIPENLELINQYAPGKTVPVILASYNSGAARVKKRMQDYGADWFKDADLKEAFKYVNRVSSYCYHFAEGDL